MTLATRRLIDASATLPAADRALLSLWTQRGLDVAAMAEMTGVDPATIARRRVRIVTDLSTQLALPPEDVAAALTAIAASAASGSGGRVEIDPADPVLEAASASPPTPGASPTGGSQAVMQPTIRQPESRSQPESLPGSEAARWRPARWLITALVSIAVVVIIVVTASSGGGDSPRTRSVASSAPAAGSPAPPSGARRFAPLPGGIPGAAGTVTVAAGPSGTQRLLVQVTGLPAAGSDHYEVWLYNSIIDSVALGHLGSRGAGGFTLPAVVTRFASIDISRQPPQSTEPSGASVLRAPNPLAAAPP